MRVNEVQGHDENDDPAQTPSHSGSRMLELWEPGALFLGLHSGGFAIVLDDRTRCHQNVPDWRGKRPAGKSESWRDLPRHESCRAIVERGLGNSKSRLRF